MKKKILYLECNSGISGDMVVAALLDLGADRRILTETLSSLPLTGYTIEIKDVFKSGIRACDFNVILDRDNHDHDMQYLHGDAQSPEPDTEHLHEHLHTEVSQIHGHLHADQNHHHNARNLNDIIEIINAGRLTENARSLAIRIFTIIARAEAAVHGKNIDEVHFHEVGAVDSIVDIVAAAVCIDNLQPDQIIVSPLTDGTGQIRCQHGIIPVPVPAVTAIAMNEGIVLKSSSVQGELVTPTGAAIAAALSSGAKLPTEYRILKTGVGAGKRSYATTGILRAMLLEQAGEDLHDTILSLETNVDDCTGEALAFTMQQLLDAGALDVFYTPIYMKKNRPAYLLKVLCRPEDRSEMETIIFRNTTTIGIRMQQMQRTKLGRQILAVETPWGMADVKCCTCGQDIYYYPENDSVSLLAKKENIGFPEMYHLIQSYVQSQNPAK